VAAENLEVSERLTETGLKEHVPALASISNVVGGHINWLALSTFVMPIVPPPPAELFDVGDSVRPQVGTRIPSS